VGGGLGVDYDGTNSSNYSSINYSLQEYANDVVFAVVNVSDKHNLPHPNIVTESGRAITAHHSVLIFNVLETMSVPLLDSHFEVDANAHENIKELLSIFKNIDEKNMFEFWHDASQIREENNTLFALSHLNLESKAIAERIYYSIAQKFKELSIQYDDDSEEFQVALRLLSDKYFCNFSLFQSLPDSWAIDQLFPVLPISMLDKKPDTQATLQDVTCDSDGKISNFINSDKLTNFLPLHKVSSEDNYLIGVFLVGAYQEILGDLHNLFGDTNTAHVKLVGDKFKISELIEGETVEEVLSYVGFNAKKMVRQIEIWVSKAVKSGKIDSAEGKAYLETYRSGLFGYTYLE
ncbi:biosynthetic arginine decarboxylase, partial [Candidatus Kapabacteria bacterium]|nr:biosynthetic arginine decarboxylase [Candidatus Kapabacteria bacterium]